MNEDNEAGFFEDESGNETSDSQRTVVGGPHGSETPAVIPKRTKSSPHTASSSAGRPSSAQESEALRDDRQRRQQTIVLDYQTRSTAKAAHTRLRKVIRTHMSEGGDIGQLAAYEARLHDLGVQITTLHHEHVRNLGRLTTDQQDVETEWLSEVRDKHTKILQETYEYKKRSASRFTESNPNAIPETDTFSDAVTVGATALPTATLTTAALKAATNELVTKPKSKTSSRRSRISQSDAEAFLKREAERLQRQQEAADAVERQKADLKAAELKLEHQRRLDEMQRRLDEARLDQDSITSDSSQASSYRAIPKQPIANTGIGNPQMTNWIKDQATRCQGRVNQQVDPPPQPNATPKLFQANPPPVNTLVKTKAASWIHQRIPNRPIRGSSGPMVAHLPKPTIEIFRGDPMMWPTFISSFKYLVHDVIDSDAQRFAYLMGYLSKEVRAELGHSLSHPDQYWNVLEELEDMYGHPHLVSKRHMDQLLSERQVKEGDKPALLSYIQKLRGAAAMLRDAGYDHELQSGVTLGQLVAKLPGTVQSKWALYSYACLTSPNPDERKILNITDLSEWLKTISMAERLLTMTNPSSSSSDTPKPFNTGSGVKDKSLRKDDRSKQSHPSQPARTFTPTMLATSVPEKSSSKGKTEQKCFCCLGPRHSMFKCEKFAALDAPTRIKLVQKNMRCFCCLSSGHSSKECPSLFRCRVEGCGEKHNALLHEPKPAASSPVSPAASTSTPKPPPSKPIDKKAKTWSFSAIRPEESQESPDKVTLLGVVRLEFSLNDKKVETSALVDNAANGSLLRDDIANELGVPGRNRPMKFNTFHNQDPFIQSREANVNISAPGGPILFNVDAYTTPTLNLDRRILDWDRAKEKWPYLALLPSPLPPNGDIGAIIGMDVVRAHLQREIIEPPEGVDGPYAVRTDLGWCVIGPVDENYICSPSNEAIPKEAIPTEASSCFSIVRQVDAPSAPDDRLQKLVLDFFKLESNGTRPNTKIRLSKLEERAVQIAESTIRHEKPGDKYEIGLPFISEEETLVNNRALALQMLERQQVRFKREPDYAKIYAEQMHQYEHLNFSRRLTEAEINDRNPRRWYMTHHGVTYPFKPGKVRVVFNASAVFKGDSLNKKLLPGPNLLKDLPGSITRFRENNVAVSSDIVKFFHNVKVPERDQPCLSYTWRPPGITGPIETRCMTRHPFGAVSSPFLCLFVLNRAAEDSQLDFPEAALRVKNNFYMDNYLDSFSTVEEAKSICLDISEIMRRAGLELTQWSSSSKKLLSHLPASDLVVPNIDLNTDPLPTERMLGIRYDPNADVFEYKIRIRPEVTTKREILGEVATQFDPLGFLAPVTIEARILLQDIWRSGTKWDEPIVPKLLDLWKKWATELPEVENLSIPRLLSCQGRPVELHIFCDASEVALGSVIYTRCPIGDTFMVNIMAARAKVAPIKPSTIPKLELEAVVLGTRLANHYLRETRLPIISVTFWSDSETTLHRIWSQKCKFQAYEANRIGEIRESFEPNQFRHIPGLLNPADELSRGVPPKLFTNDHRFIKGPDHLHGPDKDFPPSIRPIEPLEDPSVKPPRWIDTIGVDKNRPISKLINDCSDLVKLKRILALCLRFINNIRRSILEKKLSTSGSSSTGSSSVQVYELSEALSVAISLAQEESFYEEINSLRKRKTFHPSSRLAPLTPFLDKQGSLRAGGRLRKAPLPFSGRHPIILEPSHHLTRLIIEYYHKVFAHASVERLLGELRQKYLIVNGRRKIRQIVNECVACRKVKSTPQIPVMAALPPERVSPEHPFTWTGTDYFGPFYIKQGRSTIKRYGVLFTCMSTRAVHLEVAHSLTQDSFINAFRRFVSVRGRPATMFSDNGTNLTAGERELREALDEWDPEQIERYMANKGTKWRFSPPTGSHFGGVWERLVKSCKTALKAVLQNQSVSDEILLTVMAEVMALLNSRPLTHISVDPADLEPLTPNHFLLGRPQQDLPPSPFSSPQIPTKRQWRTTQAIVDQFWRRWMTEYVPSLIERRKWLSDRRNLNPDDIVLVVDSNTPRGLWPMGRIVKTLPGDDDIVRIVEVKTKDGYYIRPVSKLCLLLAAENSGPDPGSATPGPEEDQE